MVHFMHFLLIYFIGNNASWTQLFAIKKIILDRMFGNQTKKLKQQNSQSCFNQIRTSLESSVPIPLHFSREDFRMGVDG